MFGKFMKCIFRIQLSLDIFALLYIITFTELLQKRENISLSTKLLKIEIYIFTR